MKTEFQVDISQLHQITATLEIAAQRLEAITKERDAYLSNLTATQIRCTELLLENRALKDEVKRLQEDYR